ncbi:MAG TPA: NAD(P)/FAD-dependent oxidoreductase [Ktedonobacterales bacterium]
MARRYAVLGGGVLGLTAALRLVERGHEVRVFERESEPGGLAAGFVVEPEGTGLSVGNTSLQAGQAVYLEKFYHHLFRTDHAITRLIEEVGMGADLEWLRPLTVTLWQGQVYQLDSPLSLLRFPPVPLVGRLRMAAALALLKLLPSGKLLEGRTAAQWVRATMGSRAWEIVFAPLFKGKFGTVSEQIALPWLWARFHDRTSRLGYVRGGFQRFYNRLAARVREHGGQLSFGTTVSRIATDPQHTGAVTLTYSPVGQPEQTSTETFDRVISTLPTRLTCALTPELPDEYRARYDWGRAYGAHCLILALDRPMTSGYWMNVNDPGYPFMVFVEHTNYLPPEDYGGRHLVYLGNYRPMDDRLFSRNKDEVLAEFLPHLARINPDFDASWVQESWMFAAPYAQPIVTTDYREHIPPFETPLPGLYLANMFQVYPHDRGQNYSVELAERLVAQLEPGE